MRLGLITGEYPPMQGGVGDFTRELAAALGALGHDVHILTRLGCTQPEDDASPCAGACVHPAIPHWGWRSHGHLMSLARHLALEVWNIQYQAAAYDMHPAINFLPLRATLGGLRRQGRAVVVVTFHDLQVPYLFPKAGPLRHRVVTLLARTADAAVVTNRGDELALAAQGVQRVERIPIGSNIAPAALAGFDPEGWRARLGVGPEDCLVGFFGFFNARKGVETLVQAAARLDASFHLLFIGGTLGSSDPTNQGYAARIEGLIRSLGMTGRVHYTGFVPEQEVSAAFAATDLCVLPYAGGLSFHHGSLMAALAHGQAIISTQPALDLPELVHGENVWLVPPQDAGALAQAIRALAGDPECRGRLARGAATLSTQFGWEGIAARTAALFSELNRARDQA
jgi:glycosyltransferase involved in cell wall biosynthesis